MACVATELSLFALFFIFLIFIEGAAFLSLVVLCFFPLFLFSKQLSDLGSCCFKVAHILCDGFLLSSGGHLGLHQGTLETTSVRSRIKDLPTAREENTVIRSGKILRHGSYHCFNAPKLIPSRFIVKFIDDDALASFLFTAVASEKVHDEHFFVSVLLDEVLEALLHFEYLCPSRIDELVNVVGSIVFWLHPEIAH